MSNPTLVEALKHDNRRAHEIESYVTMFFLKLTSKMNCTPAEIADGLVGSISHFIAVSAMPNERAEVVDRVCNEIRRRVTGR
jgi:hypothetical protein